MKKKKRGLWYKIKRANYKRIGRNCLITVSDLLAFIMIMFLIFIIPCLFR